jgi:hypothetical protein
LDESDDVIVKEIDSVDAVTGQPDDFSHEDDDLEVR